MEHWAKNVLKQSSKGGTMISTSIFILKKVRFRVDNRTKKYGFCTDTKYLPSSIVARRSYSKIYILHGKIQIFVDSI